MDFFTSDVLATGTDRRPGRDLTARFLKREHASTPVPASATGSAKEGRHGGGRCVDL